MSTAVLPPPQIGSLLRWYLSGNGTARLKATDQRGMAPAKSSLGRHPGIQSYRKRFQPGPATAPAAPTDSYNPHSYGQIPIEPVDR